MHSVRKTHRAALISTLQQELERLSASELQVVSVCVVDSGIDASHPALAGRVSEAYAIHREGGEAKVVPVDVAANNDAFGHGTAVASIICDLAPNARIIDVRLLDERNRSDLTAMKKALQFVLEKKTRLVNLSLAAPHQMHDPLVRFCERAYYQDQIVVAAKRNLPIPDAGYPAVLSSCIGVDTQAFASRFAFKFRKRDSIEFVAMGEDIRAAQSGGGYTTKVGTSFATPVITGMCALLLGVYDDLESFEVKTILKALSLECR